MKVAFTFDRVDSLSDAERAEIRELATLVYPPEIWADWFGFSIEWQMAEWCARIRDAEGKLLAHVGLMQRQGLCEGQSALIGGIGGVKTHPDARRCGHAAMGIRRAIEFFRDELKVAFITLVCEPYLIEFYSQFGFQEFTGTMFVTQRGEREPFTFMRVMTRGVEADTPLNGTIDLLGPPW